MSKKLVLIVGAVTALLTGLALLLYITLDPATPTAEALRPASSTPTATPKAQPTATPQPTSTPIVAPTPTATSTPQPTSTPRPTATPVPTPTPRPPFKTLFSFQKDDKVTQLRPGVIQVQRVMKGPVRVNLMLFDLTAPQLDMRVVSPEDTLGGTARTSAMAKANNALVAVNGDEFSNGLPQGMMISDGRLFIAPKHLATFGWTKDRQPFIGYFTQDWTWPSEVVAENGSKRALQLLNTPCDSNWLCIYNEYYRQIPNRYGELRVVLDENYRVIDIKEDLAIKILPGQTVLVGKGLSRNWLKENVRVGDTLKPNLVTNPDFRQFQQVVSGGPVLLDQGEFVQDCLCDLRDCGQAPPQYRGPLCEEFPTSWKYEHYLTIRMPRIAIGFNQAKTTLVLAVVDGYQPGVSIGMTQKELAALMQEFGSYSAMELDGGGSATMVVQNKIISKPSDGGGAVERYVANALAFYWNDDANNPRGLTR